MPRFIISLVNHEYQSRDDGGEYDTAEAALALGVESGLAIAAEEIRQGRSGAAVEISIVQEDGRPALRSVVTISVLALIPDGAPIAPPSDEPDRIDLP